MISDVHVCSRTQSPQPHHMGMKQHRWYHGLGWCRGTALCWLLLRGFHCANSGPGLEAKAGMSFTVFHFSSLFTLFTTAQALFLLCLLCNSQHFTGESLIPILCIKVTPAGNNENIKPVHSKKPLASDLSSCLRYGQYIWKTLYLILWKSSPLKQLLSMDNLETTAANTRME